MALFGRRKKKKKEAGYLEARLQPDLSIEPKREAEHEALICCERLLDEAREMEEYQKEYRLVTSYLKDIQIIEELPEHEASHLREWADQIIQLESQQDHYANREKHLSEAQFAQMEQLADQIPDATKRLLTNERYQAMVKRDIDNLEGEKAEWGYYLEAMTQERRILKLVLWGCMILYLIGLGVLAYLHSITYRDLSLWLLGITLAATVLGGGCILRLQYAGRQKKRAQTNVNRAITLSNQMKAKYVNATNAVDYACEKFHVRNSMELTYLWEQYMEAVRQREKYEKVNEDFVYFSNRLVHQLRKYNLYDPEIWVHQTAALADPKEMVEVKHNLLVRRQKLRARIEQQLAQMQAGKSQILQLLKDKKEFQKEIMDVLQSIDQMCGL